MIRKLAHLNFVTNDLEKIIDFYVNKLGMEVRTDATFGEGQRWLTVGPKGQPDLELTLMPATAGPHLPAEKVAAVRELIGSNTFGIGVLETDDIHRDYEDLRAKGVEFVSAPQEQFYGIESLFRDDSGNWFSMTQRTTT